MLSAARIGGFQRGIELALLADRIEDGGAALFEFAQIVQALFQRAQLRVVERAGGFLAVSRDERNRRAAVEQRHRRLDLLLADPKFFRDLLIDICHAKSFQSARAGSNHRPRDAAYGPSPIDYQPAAMKEIDLWIDAFRPPKRSDLKGKQHTRIARRDKAEIRVDRRRFNV